ncbi:Uncharacterised protein [Mycobacterium tuberculosis]|uniref:Uncharacterized protein n=1 Tax=Mycobacterium tuberculosis TaxID=1773 RepID=A0A916PAZ6_MYCTX|nr:Uncharacterised protein [Mycobacterium tuberculosis]
MKQVWVNSATCVRTASTTRGDVRCGTGDFGDQAPTLLQAGHRSSSPGSPVHIAGKAYLLTDVSGLPDWTGTLDCYQVRGPRVGLAP